MRTLKIDENIKLALDVLQKELLNLKEKSAKNESLMLTLEDFRESLYNYANDEELITAYLTIINAFIDYCNS